MFRTHTCGDLRKNNAGSQVTLAGWVQHKRNFGGVLFVVLRDRFGETQINFRPENKELFEKAESLKSQDVVNIIGTVVLRPSDARNPKMLTGDVEVVAEILKIFSRSKTPIFSIEDEINATEETRLRYRYLDLRRPIMQKNIVIRHKAASATREFLNSEDFIEIETPYMTKSTPEGARDYLVPSRTFPGRFYALPQSPQIYKQILMVAGFDKYYSLPRCFRDEDPRADRQPEFTQIDIEMSFTTAKDIMDIAERLTAHILHKTIGFVLPLPLRCMTYDEAILRYGSDKPDLRIPIEIYDITDFVSNCGFDVFEKAVLNGVVRTLPIPKASQFSRKKIDRLAELAKEWGAKGLAYTKFIDGKFESGIAKFLTSEFKAKLIERLNENLVEDCMLFFVADRSEVAAKVLGGLRVMLATELGLIDKSTHNVLWIINFPLFEPNEENPEGITPSHHPFTSPVKEHIALLESDPLSVRADAYDLVMDGYEIAGGSIRIHEPELQNRIFRLLGMNTQQVQKKFGFLLEAFEYGVPPHGGIAFGFDRLAMILAGQDSIREVIAFPKTTAAQSLMDGSPTEVDIKQLEELSLKIIEKKDKK